VQDHDFYVVLVIWDSPLTRFKDLVSYVESVTIGHIETARGRVVSAQFATAISALQNSVLPNMCPVLKKGFLHFSGTSQRDLKSNFQWMS
jgi:hypothetical protein